MPGAQPSSPPRRWLLPPAAWPAACPRAWEPPKHGFGLHGCLVTQTVGRPQSPGIHTTEGAQKHPGPGGCFPKKRIPLHSTFCQGIASKDFENNLALEAKWPCTSGRQGAGPRPVWGLRRGTAVAQTPAVTCWVGVGGCYPSLLPDAKLRES